MLAGDMRRFVAYENQEKPVLPAGCRDEHKKAPRSKNAMAKRWFKVDICPEQCPVRNGTSIY